MVHNMNYVTKRADSDGTMDESSWGFGGYMAECGGRIINKKVPTVGAALENSETKFFH